MSEDMGTKRKAAMTVLTGFLVAVAIAPSASAHAERTSSEPEAGSRLGDPPSEITIDFTEPPTGDSTFEVLDGCGTDVVQEASAQNLTLQATLAPGQPGRWAVATQVISAVDGHPTSDTWSFRVRGEADCSEAGANSPAPPQARDDGDEGGGAPIVPIAAGGIVLAIAAIAARILTTRH